jgi:threonine synthase
MNDLKVKKEFQLTKQELKNLTKTFVAFSISEDETLQTIRNVYASTKFVIDPHSAIGFKALKKYNNFKIVCLIFVLKQRIHASSQNR